MPISHIFWDEHRGKWPPHKDGRRWTDAELDELKQQLNRVGLSQVSDAIGSLQLDKIQLSMPEIIKSVQMVVIECNSEE